MIIKNFLKTTKWKFQKELTEESVEDCKNPGRGWYRVYSFDIKEEFPKEDWYWGVCPTEQLALLMVDLGAFQKEPISKEALSNLENCLAFFKENKKELILRFVYDRKGEGIRHEPSSVSRIQGHMEQIGPILASYETTIFCLQGLFIGSWGEMHGSKFLAEPYLLELWDKMQKIVPSGCFCAVRKPKQWRWLEREAFIKECRLGLFNDGLLGSETDLGTYEEEQIQEELEFQNRICQYVPNGGEAVGKRKEGNIEEAVKRFSQIHISYLNSVYDEQVLTKWKQSEYQGENGYDYIGRRLGYRFVVSDVKFTNKKQPVLEIMVENRGFACIYEACSLSVVLLEASGKEYQVEIQEDARLLEPNHKKKIVVKLDFLPMLCQSQEFRCSIQLKRKKDGASIRFANKGAREQLRLGRFFYG